ncbi:MAG: phenylalanine--tRNA ligase subunit alpha [Candidatus Neomarinimicrobiota bacterium]
MSLSERINSVRNQFLTEFKLVNDNLNEIDLLKNKYLSRKGLIASLFSSMGDLNNKEKPEIGKKLNLFKSEVAKVINQKEYSLKLKKSKKNLNVDLSLPGKIPRVGSLHILEQTLIQVKNIFKSIGFSVSYGPEVDDEYHNFTALNIPEHHPARDMQDTFFIDNKTVLRTHTSNVQIHLMEKQDPPMRYIIPGRVYRNESIGYKSYCLFHQVEGIYINKKVSFSELKGCLEFFIKQMFGPKKKMRFRPSFFPFTEPSAEVDIWNEERNEWMEILGCGMVDPSVLVNVGYNPDIWHGYAFGMGIERMAMLKYNIKDIRYFYNGDIRFMEQFS